LKKHICNDIRDKILNNVTTDMSDIILKYQNLSLLSISILSTFACIYYNTVNNQATFNFLQTIIGTYSIVDLYYSKSIDFKIHHILTLGLLYYNIVYNVHCSDLHIITYSFIKTEISSIFLILKYYLDKKSAFYHINNIVFYILFFKLRIYDIYYNVIKYDSQIYTIINKYTPNSYYKSSILIVSCYGLYILNLYWFMLLSKILYKKIVCKYLLF
jgi:hypothetical protein